MKNRSAGSMFHTIMTSTILVFATLTSGSSSHSQAALSPVKMAQQYVPIEWAYKSHKIYTDAFNQVDVDVVFTDETGQQWRVPTFWAGGNEWRVRFAPPVPGNYKFHAESTDAGNPDLNGHEGILRAEPYRGANPLLMHGPLKVSANRRYFEYSDGTPFLWLGDTWWDGLCRRISLDEFRTLAADRESKGFNVVQIVAGLYPDEPPFDDRGKNEGGYVWEADYARINPAYFDAADRRIKALVDAGLSPAIVGSWGYYLPLMGVAKAKKHWRNLIARYGAFPVVWIMSGELPMPYYLSDHPREDSALQRKGWTELAKYVHDLDPYRHMITAHPSQSARQEVLDESTIDFDMLQTGHGSWGSASNSIASVSAHYSKTPPMPVLIGETVYEGHQQTNWQDIQRFAFWTSMMNGAAGQTYGAGGIWQMNGRTIPHGLSPWGITYENTSWDVAMRLPGSQQVGIGKGILMKYPWWQFEPHPEWVEPHGTAFQKPHADWFDTAKRWDEEHGEYVLPYASGIPGKLRFVYIPPRIYKPIGPLIIELEENIIYDATYYDPATGDKYELGRVLRPKLLPLLEDTFQSIGNPDWLEIKGNTSMEPGRLLTHGPTWIVRKDTNESNVVVSVDARSDVNAGIILRSHDADNSLIAVYSSALKGIWIHDRQNGHYGSRLGFMEIPEIGPDIHLVAEAHAHFASLTITDGHHIYRTSPVEVTNIHSGSIGIWSERLSCQGGIAGGGCQVDDNSSTELQNQTFEHFTASRIEPVAPEANPNLIILNAWRAPNLPLSHDWLLTLEHYK
jgi:Protein of unknown function (DUF4038)/Domain of unknown function (DUF5060)